MVRISEYTSPVDSKREWLAALDKQKSEKHQVVQFPTPPQTNGIAIYRRKSIYNDDTSRDFKHPLHGSSIFDNLTQSTTIEKISYGGRGKTLFTPGEFRKNEHQEALKLQIQENKQRLENEKRANEEADLKLEMRISRPHMEIKHIEETSNHPIHGSNVFQVSLEQQASVEKISFGGRGKTKFIPGEYQQSDYQEALKLQIQEKKERLELERKRNQDTDESYSTISRPLPSIKATIKTDLHQEKHGSIEFKAELIDNTSKNVSYSRIPKLAPKFLITIANVVDISPPVLKSFPKGSLVDDKAKLKRQEQIIQKELLEKRAAQAQIEKQTHREKLLQAEKEKIEKSNLSKQTKQAQRQINTTRKLLPPIVKIAVKADLIPTPPRTAIDPGKVSSRNLQKVESALLKERVHSIPLRPSSKEIKSAEERRQCTEILNQFKALLKSSQQKISREIEARI